MIDPDRKADLNRPPVSRRALPALALLTCVIFGLACGNGDSTGPDASAIPDILGIYAGTWNNRVAVASTGQEVSVSCDGSVLIKEQDADGAFSGFWTQVGNVGEGCPGAAGPLAGRVTAGGTLTIAEFGNSTSPSLAESTGGQCAIVAGSNAVAGFSDGRTLEISRSARADCGGTEIAYSWELSATRTD